MTTILWTLILCANLACNPGSSHKNMTYENCMILKEKQSKYWISYCTPQLENVK